MMDAAITPPRHRVGMQSKDPAIKSKAKLFLANQVPVMLAATLDRAVSAGTGVPGAWWWVKRGGFHKCRTTEVGESPSRAISLVMTGALRSFVSSLRDLGKFCLELMIALDSI